MYAGMEAPWSPRATATTGSTASRRGSHRRALPRGERPQSAAVAGAIGGVLAGAAMAGKQLAKRYVPAI